MEDYLTGQRSSAIAGPPTRQTEVRAASINDVERTFEAVPASETPAPMTDYRRGEIVDEVLVATGGRFPSSVPLLDSHSRNSSRDVVGSMRNFRREGSQWLGTGRIATGDSHADTVWSKIRDGHLDSLSIGYRIHEFYTIEPRQSATIGGRNFSNNSDRALRVVTEWQVDEVSIVAVPADATAKIRNAEFHRSQEPMPAIHTRSSVTSQPSQGMLESALMLRMGISDPSRARVRYDHKSQMLTRLAPCDAFEQQCDQARSWHNAHLCEIVRAAAALDGVQGLSDVGHAGILGLCWQHFSRGSMSISTSALGGAFLNTFGAMFLQGYDLEEDTTEGWVSEEDNLSLKPEPRTRLSTLSPFTPRAKGREANHVAVSTPYENSRVNEFSAQFVIDEQDILGNLFGSAEQIVPDAMGSAAKRLRPDLVYSVLLSNPTMRDGVALFHASHANLQGSSALADGTLTSAQVLIGSQTEGGTPLNLRGRYLIVPTSLERTGSKLVSEAWLPPDDSFPPMLLRSEGQLQNGLVDPLTGVVYAGSTTTWFLSAAGRQHTIEVSYLQGTNRQPVIRSGFLQEGQFGMWFDVQHFIGATPLDWRGMAKSTS